MGFYLNKKTVIVVSMSESEKVDETAPATEKEVPVEKEEVSAKKQRRKANKAPNSPRKLAKKARASKKEEVVETDDFLSKVRGIALPIWRDYIRVFLLKNLLAVTVVVAAIVIVYLQIVAMNTLPTQVASKMNTAGGGLIEFTDRVNFTIAVGNDKDNLRFGDIEIGLYGTKCPLTVKNFLQLCRGTKGYGYKHTNFFFLRPGALIAGGDVLMNTGEASKSALEAKGLAGENFDIPHFACCIGSPEIKNDENVSQFYLTFQKIKSMDEHGVVFGRVSRGLEFFFSLNKVKVDKDTAKPLENIEIVDVKIVKEDELDEKVKMDAKLDEMITDMEMKDLDKGELEKMLHQAAKKLAKEKAKELGVSEEEFEQKVADMIAEAKEANYAEDNKVEVGDDALERVQETLREVEEAKAAEQAAEDSEEASVADVPE